MVLATADAGRPAERPDRAAQGVRPERASSSSPTTRSRKGAELAANPCASLVFPWYPMHRQVMVAGPVEPVAGPRPRPTSPPGRAARSSAPGPARSRRWCRTGPRWTRRCRRRPSGSPTGRDPGAAALGRVAGRPGDGGVLAGPRRPAARPAALPAYRGRRLGRRAARPVTAVHGRPGRRGARRWAIDTPPAAVPGVPAAVASATRWRASASSSPRSRCRCRCTP